LSQSIDLPTVIDPKVDDFLQELATIQQTGAKRIAMLGSRHVPIIHQHMIEMLSYALVLGGNRLLTSGATGTNAAAIRGAMRADPNLLTVVLPQSLWLKPAPSAIKKLLPVVSSWSVLRTMTAEHCFRLVRKRKISGS
jgi:hypothetical protein